MANWNIIPPQSAEHWEKLYELRYRVLRKDWNQAPGSEIAPDDDEAVHAIVFSNKRQVLACCRAHRSSDAQIQLRYMAVDPVFRGYGLGKALLKYIEKVGADRYQPVHQIILHARENAVPFYERNGYNVISPSHVLFGTIQHFLMMKTLV